jgi:hypothetical protein
MRYTTLAALLALLLLPGCATKHAYMSQPRIAIDVRTGQITPILSEPFWSCDTANNCSLMQTWDPPQLTPLGCILHTLGTGGHIAWECRKPKNGKAATGGKWIWKH